VIPQANTQARTFPVEIVLENESGALKAGMFVRVRAPSGPRVESIIVPRDAVLQRRGAYYVVSIVPSPQGEGKMAMPVPVEPGSNVGDWIAVNSPMLQPGALVAVKGHDRVYAPQPAMPVNVTLDAPDCSAGLEKTSAQADASLNETSAEPSP